MYSIKRIKAREIIDSRATPTLEVDLELTNGGFGRFSVPSGTSTGAYEALELRDKDDQRFLGKGVLKSINYINNIIFPNLVGKYFDTQESFDSYLIGLDGSTNKSYLGANTILALSVAFAKAVANYNSMYFFEYIGLIGGNKIYSIPQPMFNIMNGGKHANWSTDFQEYMIIINHKEYAEVLRIACEIFLTLEKLLKAKNLSINVGNEGGFAPGFTSNIEAFNFISDAVEKAGYTLGKDVFFAIDVAASEFYEKEEKIYFLKTENKKVTGEELLDIYLNLLKHYPIISIEDPFAEDDWGMWTQFHNVVGDSIHIVGDDLLVTNISRIKQAYDYKACNALLVKMNQIGTLTETINAIKLCKEYNWYNIVSHRSGETEDVSIVHLAVGMNVDKIKAGAPSRGERTCKYNELLRIGEIVNRKYN
ncbi:MAG: phosphopyruvate hydratase [Candidatus Dojkabacteria bacterium]|nr:phosphopyruvate hydratase [Candidatus Dojkabacteria bacterium]